ncbi:hypothetical protein KNP414_07220 [Paenibacillus mucilaginosus KNP414]|uniref:Uncharacterized protein n=1 Tax=Paenibacillus mucilaginosus (strain KNP414) TaxID=1036673 RepID=F8FN60_PAEMK|nr:hypothetical protein KNP414_07220 [Paenibacillus mucilaginosus KNP414]
MKGLRPSRWAAASAASTTYFLKHSKDIPKPVAALPAGEGSRLFILLQG